MKIFAHYMLRGWSILALIFPLLILVMFAIVILLLLIAGKWCMSRIDEFLDMIFHATAATAEWAKDSAQAIETFFDLEKR